jgi:hypothetical protein
VQGASPWAVVLIPSDILGWTVYPTIYITLTLMSDRVSYVDDVLGFSFEKGTFRERFEELGCPEPDLEIWYRNALVYSTITQNRRPREAERIRLLTMIEAVRLQAMSFYPPLPGEEMEFDLTSYEFSEDVLLFKQEVVDMILGQERRSPSPDII